MQRQEVYNSLEEVFEETFLDDFNFSESLTANEVEEWDSLVHVSLIISIEQKFKIRFDAGEVTKAKDVGELITMIEELIARK